MSAEGKRLVPGTEVGPASSDISPVPEDTRVLRTQKAVAAKSYLPRVPFNISFLLYPDVLKTSS